METKLYEINVTLLQDDKENIFNAFINHTFTQLVLKSDSLHGNDTLLVPEKSVRMNNENLNVLDEKTFSELYKNNCYITRSGLKNFELSTPPTVVESLEVARKRNEGIVIDLDYSLLTTYSTGLDVMLNMVKLMTN